MRREQTIKIQKGIYLLFGILEGLLGIRFVLGFLGANPAAGFAEFIYGITGPFIAPFAGLFGRPRFEGSVFDFNSLVAIVVYALIAWVLVKIVWLTMADRARSTHGIEPDRHTGRIEARLIGQPAISPIRRDVCLRTLRMRRIPPTT